MEIFCELKTLRKLQRFKAFKCDLDGENKDIVMKDCQFEIQDESN